MERIITTERHAELPSKALIKATAQAIHEYRYPSSMEHEAECLLRKIEPLIREDERVRVVEGLVATVKALDLTTEVRAEADGHAVTNFTNVDSVGLAAVLAVVEAARENND